MSDTFKKKKTVTKNNRKCFSNFLGQHKPPKQLLYPLAVVFYYSDKKNIYFFLLLFCSNCFEKICLLPVTCFSSNYDEDPMNMQISL